MKHSKRYLRSCELFELLENAKQRLYESTIVANKLRRTKTIRKIEETIGIISKIQRREV